MERYRTTIVLGAVLLLLAMLAFFLNGRSANSPGTATPTATVYIWEDSNPVRGLEVVSGSNRIVLSKDVVSGTWRIDEPVSQPADLFQVGNVADSLQRLQAQYTLTGTTDLAQYGLTGEPMQVTATYSDTQGSTRTLLIGNATPDGAGYYVKTPENNAVYTVGNVTLEPLRTWLISPPVQPPTPTLVPVTPVSPTPTVALTGTVTLTGTVGITPTMEITPSTGPTSPPPGATATAAP